MHQLAAVFGGTHNPGLDFIHTTPGASYARMYDLLWSLYFSDTYEDLSTWADVLGVADTTTLHAIRNPTARTVEFYSAHLWPGTLPHALPIDTENDNLPDAIERVWAWSNWASQKQAVARSFSLLGDWFLKVPQKEDGRPYLQTLDPAQVVDFDEDERGNISWIRIDVPQRERRADGTIRHYYYVEVWDKGEGRFRVWQTERANVPLDQLGTPQEDQDIQSFGIDFVPFVHGQFRDVGQPRGIGAVTLAFRKIVEADLIATALHERLFRYGKADWTISAASVDVVKHERPPDLDINTDNEADSITLNGETVFRLPAGWSLQSLIANIPYADALSILKDHMAELENDLPELAYYNLRDFGSNISGRAIRLMLSDALSRLMEARGNAETALVKAHKMALTMGQVAGLPDFRDIGTFENGDFEHEFKHREVIDLPEAEIAETEHNRELAYQLKLKRGYSNRHLMREDGLTDEGIDEMLSEAEAAGAAQGSAVLRAFDAGLL